MMRAQSENAGDTVSEVVKSPEEKKVPKLRLKRGLKSRHYKEFLKKSARASLPAEQFSQFSSHFPYYRIVRVLRVIYQI
jgi:hypothetical protein